MTNRPIPGELPHNPPARTEQNRIMSIRPYVREAQEVMRPTWQIHSRKLFDFLLVHWIDGTGQISVGNQSFPAQNGDLFWVPPNTLHTMRGDAPGTLLQYVHFDLEYDPTRSHWSASIPGNTIDLSAWPERMHPPVTDPVIKTWCGKIQGSNPSLITETLRRIILEYNKTQSSNLIISGLICQLIESLRGDPCTAQSSTGRHIQAIENAMSYIQTHSHQKLNIETLAKQHRLSPAHFRKLFREHYHQSPRTAHLNAKMRAACDYLIYSDLNISEVADRLDFTNIHNFSRAFHKIIGRSPSEYRSGQGKTRPS